jgi:hypothetical protein
VVALLLLLLLLLLVVVVVVLLLLLVVGVVFLSLSLDSLKALRFSFEHVASQLSMDTLNSTY